MSLEKHPYSELESQDHPYSGTVWGIHYAISESPAFFKEKLKGQTLIDIGSPEPMVAYAFLGRKAIVQRGPLFQNSVYYNGIFDEPLDLGLEKFVMVDPFHIRRGTNLVVEKELAAQPDLSGKVVLASCDGLEFLRSQPSESACVMTTSIDCFIINQGLDYFSMLVEEIYRVVPKGGIYVTMCSDSDVYAKKIFQKHYSLGLGLRIFDGHVFEKSR